MNRFFRICFLCVAGACLFMLGMWFSSYLFYKNEIKIYETPIEIGTGSEQSFDDYVPTVETTAASTVDMNTEFVIIKENLVTFLEETKNANLSGRPCRKRQRKMLS